MADTLDRARMEAIIKTGGSVLHKGVLYSRLDQLPSEAALAGTPEERAQARAKLEAQRDEIDRQLAALDEAEKAAEKDEPKDEPKKAEKKAEKEEK